MSVTATKEPEMSAYLTVWILVMVTQKDVSQQGRNYQTFESCLTAAVDARKSAKPLVKFTCLPVSL